MNSFCPQNWTCYWLTTLRKIYFSLLLLKIKSTLCSIRSSFNLFFSHFQNVISVNHQKKEKLFKMHMQVNWPNSLGQNAAPWMENLLLIANFKCASCFSQNFFTMKLRSTFHIRLFFNPTIKNSSHQCQKNRSAFSSVFIKNRCKFRTFLNESDYFVVVSMLIVLNN